MAVPLIIVESEAKAVLLRAQLGEEVEVAVMPTAPAKASWLVPKDKLKRIRPRFDFTPLPAAKPVLDRLHAALDREMYLALDNNIQGEYWSWLLSGHLAEASKGRQVPGRLRLLGLNRDQLRHSLRLVDTIREEAAVLCHLRLLLNACLGKHLDRLLGTRYAPGNLPLDSCTLTIVALLREREAELAAHTSSLKWQVRTVFTCRDSSFAAHLCFAYGLSEDGVFGQAAQARAAGELFREQAVVVREIRRVESFLPPPPPYRWPELVQEAFLRHGLSPLQVGRALEDLAAGLQLDSTQTALIGPICALAPVPCGSLLARIREFLAGQGLELGSADHEAEPEPGSLLPLRPEVGPEGLPAAVAAETRTIYAMIRARALASQMAPARIETGEVELGAGETCRFSAGLRRALAPGFLEVDHGLFEKDLLAPSPLDHLQEGEPVTLAQTVPGPTHGSPAELYNLTALVSDLEEYGLAADPSVPVRLGRMVESGYIDLLPEGGLGLGENAKKTAAVLDRALPTLAGLQLPALIGQLAQEMATGRKPLDFGLHQLEQTLIMRGTILVKSAAAVPASPRRSSRSIIKVDVPARPAAKVGERGRERTEAPAAPIVPAGGETPIAPKPMAEAEARPLPPPEESAPVEEAAPVLPEEDAPAETDEREPEAAGVTFGVETTDAEELAELAAAIPAEAAEAFLPENDAPATGRPCPVCGQPLVIKEDRFGSYAACSGFPACRFAETSLPEEPLMACPLCRQGSIMVTRTASGRTIYVCRAEGCEFLAWSRPHAGKCPVCQAPYLVEQKKGDGGIVLGCPRNGCSYRQGQEGAAEQVGPAGPRRVRVRVVKRAAGAAAGPRKVVVVRRKK